MAERQRRNAGEVADSAVRRGVRAVACGWADSSRRREKLLAGAGGGGRVAAPEGFRPAGESLQLFPAQGGAFEGRIWMCFGGLASADSPRWGWREAGGEALRGMGDTVRGPPGGRPWTLSLGGAASCPGRGLCRGAPGSGLQAPARVSDPACSVTGSPCHGTMFAGRQPPAGHGCGAARGPGAEQGPAPRGGGGTRGGRASHPSSEKGTRSFHEARRTCHRAHRLPERGRACAPAGTFVMGEQDWKQERAGHWAPPAPPPSRHSRGRCLTTTGLRGPRGSGGPRVLL